MKRVSVLLGAAFTLFALTAPHSVKAQEWAAPASSCLSEFYNAQNYGWLTYRNNCSQALWVTLVHKDGSGVGSISLRPGGQDGPGLNRNEIAEVGGMEAYACPYAYNPVDPDGRLITEPVSQYRCKRATDR